MVYLLQDENLQNQHTACIQVGVAKQEGYVPGISLSALFDIAVASTIEVNGRTVKTARNSREIGYGENYIKDGDTFKITLTVATPVHVTYFYAGGDKSFGVIEVREIKCPPPTAKK